ncbi:hypothetical protein [Plantactinospora sp. KBS50]|uniref:hypothetical protein n=1 Tax=Plantactinospora sp. KBS50 TaxID=2024580 RepID=UPI0012FD81E8|nr:hypothetical protein [Plantactinospora sp. KBS50]
MPHPEHYVRQIIGKLNEDPGNTALISRGEPVRVPENHRAAIRVREDRLIDGVTLFFNRHVLGPIGSRSRKPACPRRTTSSATNTLKPRPSSAGSSPALTAA